MAGNTSSNHYGRHGRLDNGCNDSGVNERSGDFGQGSNVLSIFPQHAMIVLSEETDLSRLNDHQQNVAYYARMQCFDVLKSEGLLQEELKFLDEIKQTQFL